MVQYGRADGTRKHGDLTLKDAEGTTALTSLREDGHAEIVQLLKDADVNAKCQDGKTALHYCFALEG